MPKRLPALTLMVSLIMAFTQVAVYAEALIHVKKGRIYKGSGPKVYRAIQQDNLCRPDLSDGDLLNAFTRVSAVGANNIAFTLDGFSADGKEIDPAYIETVVRIKDNANYRWTNAICNVMGNVTSADPRVRLNAARAAGRALKDFTSMLYVIQGPDSEALTKAFKSEAPDLCVAATYGGDVDLINDLRFAKPNQPAILIGDIPEGLFGGVSSILPDTPASYERYEERSAHAIESEPWLADPFGLTSEEEAEGFVMLYNGRNMDNWTVTGRKDGFVSENGNIIWKRRGGRRVLSRQRYDNFVLRLEYKIHHHNGNSGLFLRAPRANRESAMGMEFQIMGDYGLEPNNISTGAIYDQVAATSNPSLPEGEWNDLEIYANGSHLKATLNSIVVQDLDLNEYTELRHRLRNGFIALQDHNDPVSFRRIRIKEL